MLHFWTKVLRLQIVWNEKGFTDYTRREAAVSLFIFGFVLDYLDEIWEFYWFFKNILTSRASCTNVFHLSFHGEETREYETFIFESEVINFRIVEKIVKFSISYRKRLMELKQKRQ